MKISLQITPMPFSRESRVFLAAILNLHGDIHILQGSHRNCGVVRVISVGAVV